VIEELLRRVRISAEETGARTLIVSGGVACNTGLRTAAREPTSYPVHFDPRPLHRQRRHDCRRGIPKVRSREFADFTLRADASLALA